MTGQNHAPAVGPHSSPTAAPGEAAVATVSALLELLPDGSPLFLFAMGLEALRREPVNDAGAVWTAADLWRAMEDGAAAGDLQAVKDAANRLHALMVLGPDAHRPRGGRAPALGAAFGEA